jgi:hypothetical protein
MTDTRDQWAALVQARTAKPQKYGAKAKIVDGIRFQSSKEARRFQELKLLEKAGDIHDLRLQQPLELCAFSYMAGTPRIIGKHLIDFVYCICLRTPCVRSHLVYEDVKGFDVPLGRWKRKHAEIQYGITIRLIK